MELIFIEETSGLSKKEREYHLLKLADPQTFENHLISYDPHYLKKEDFQQFQRGEKVRVEGQLRTMFTNTNFVCTHIESVI